MLFSRHLLRLFFAGLTSIERKEVCLWLLLYWAEFDISHSLEEVSRLLRRSFLILHYAQQVFLFRRLCTLLMPNSWLARSAEIKPKVRTRLSNLLDREVKLTRRVRRRLEVKIILTFCLLRRWHRIVLIHWHVLLLLLCRRLTLPNLLGDLRIVITSQMRGRLLGNTLPTVFGSYLLRRSAQLNAGYILPILEDLQQLFYRWPVLRIRHKNDADQISQFRGNSLVLLRHEILTIEDANLLRVLEWVKAERERKSDATKHPHVRLRVNPKLEEAINHLRRSIHHRREALIRLDGVVELVGRHRRMVSNAFVGRAKVAQPESLALRVEQYVLDLDVAVLDALCMHVGEATRHVLKNMYDLLFHKYAVIFNQQIEQSSTLA